MLMSREKKREKAPGESDKRSFSVEEWKLFSFLSISRLILSMPRVPLVYSFRDRVEFVAFVLSFFADDLSSSWLTHERIFATEANGSCSA